MIFNSDYLMSDEVETLKFQINVLQHQLKLINSNFETVHKFTM